MAGYQGERHNSSLIICWDRCNYFLKRRTKDILAISVDRMKEGYKKWA